MRLPFLRSKEPAPERRPRAVPADDAAAVVEAARLRARRRLVGAAVLLLAGVIGFPLLFETQPRPLPVDTPIEVRPRDLAAAPAPVPAPRTPAPPAPPPDAVTEAPATPATVDAAKAGDAAKEGDVASPAGVTAVAPLPAPATPSPTAPAAPAAPAVRPAPVAPTAKTAQTAPTPPAPRPDDGARARALLEGGASAPAAARFVVQVGAYSDPGALRQARQRVEKLGLQTYTQVVETAAGPRTRVRIGPYANREQADAAVAKVKAAGLPAAILVL
ncbi:MAG: SPOR domain-containing protein [Rubrivivax sp.]|nr:SPOR domain-containing protein [Rubrivivax sp.]